MKTSLKVVLGLSFAASAVLPASPREVAVIDHKPVGCVVADRFPRFEARVSPAGDVASARLLFQGSGSSDWFWVAMKAEDGVFTGVLPKPRKDLKSFRYYVEVTDRAMTTARTGDITPRVVGSSSECASGLTALALSAASVVLQGPAAVIPAGFLPTGIVMAGSSVAVSGAAGASAGAGGGMGGTGLLIGGVAAAGGAVALALPKDANPSSTGTTVAPPSPSPVPSPSPAPTATPVAQYSIAFAPFLDVSVCAGRPLQWSSQAVGSLDSAGNFDLIWSPNEPNTLRISGRVTGTTFQANLACTNGAGSGTISATGSNGSFTGSFDFTGSRGQVTISRVS